MRLVSLVFGLSCLDVLPACNGGDEPEVLEVAVEVVGDDVTLSWDQTHTMHEVTVFKIVPNTFMTSVWALDTFEYGAETPNTLPTIRPPLTYGQTVDDTFTTYGPEPLERGTSYDVQMFEWAWGEKCEEVGIPSDPTTKCYLARGEARFTF